MTKNQLYTSRNEALPTKPCDCASQDIVFDLKKYDPYFNKIRALFVPSLEYRFQSLLKEFVYNTNSRWAKQFSCFKKFVDMIIMWKDLLSRVVEYDISTMEKIMKNTIKRMIKDDLIICFLNSVILHHRLKKVCRELNTLGIEDNILKNLNVWNFINEQDYLDRNCFMNFNTTISMDCNTNLNTVSYDTKRSIKYKKTVKPLAKKIYDRNTEHIQSTTSKYRKHRILALNQNFLQHKEDNSNYYSTYVATGSTRQNDYNTDKINKSFNEKSCNTESKKIRNDLKLKIIIHKVQIEDHKYSTFSSVNITRLPLPCKPSNLIRQIFETDPSLTESCLIVMKRKFEDSMYNISSCLNSVIEKLNIKFTKTLCLNCEIYSEYISFKLKAPNIKKHLFVTRVPICQNIHKCMVQEDFSILSSKSRSTELIKLKCFTQCKDNCMNFNDVHVDTHEKAEKLDTCYSQSDEADRSFIKNIMIDIAENKTENNNENSSRYVERYFINCSCNDPCKDNVEEIYNMTSCVDNSVEKNRKYCTISNSMDINYNDDIKKCRKEVLESSNLITRNSISMQLVNNANCTCSLYENFIGSNEIEDIFSNKDLDSFSQTTGTNECDCLSNKKSNLENEICNNYNEYGNTLFIQNSEYNNANCTCISYENYIETNSEIKDTFNKIKSNKNLDNFSQTTGINEHDCLSTKKSNSKIELENKIYTNTNRYSIASFIQNSEYDKQLVELNYNRFSNNINRIDKHFDTQENDSLLNSAKVETGCNSCCSCRCNDFIDITVTDNILRKNICAFETSQNNFDAVTTARSTDYSKIVQASTSSSNSLTISIQMPKSKILSKEIDVDTFYPRIVWLTYENDKNIPIKETSDGCNEIANLSTHTLIVSKKRNQFFSDMNKEMLDVKDGTQNFVTSSERFSVSKGRFRSNGDSRSSDISTREYLRSKTHLTSNASLYCRSFVTTSEFAISDRRDKFQKSMLRGRRTASRRYPNNYSGKIRPQMVFAITKFRNSIDKSIDRIKRLIREKLRRTLFNNKISNNNKMTKIIWKTKESSEDTRKKETSDKCDYSITSCSTYDCCKRSYTTSSCKSSVFLSTSRTKKKERYEENIKFCDHGLENDNNKVLLSFRSIKPSLQWSYDSLTSITEDIEKQKLNRNNRIRYDKKEKIGNIMNYISRNSHRYDSKNSETNITISLQSTKTFLTESDSKYYGHITYKHQEKTYDNKRICKQMCNQDHHKNDQMRYEYEQCRTRNKYRDIPIKYSNVNSNKSFKTLLLHSWRKNARNIHKRLYDISELNKVKRFACSCSRKNKQIFEKDISDHSNDSLRSNANLRKRYAFAILTDACNDYIDDLDLNFKLRLLRYVELCKSIKRSLIRTTEQYL